MAAIDIEFSKPAPFLERHGKLVAVCAAIWFVSIVIFSGANWIDRVVLGPADAPYSVFLFGWFRGALPWLLLGPVVFRFGARQTNHDLKNTLISAASAGFICMVIVGSWAAFVFSIGTENSPLDVLRSFRLMDWLWDVTFYVVIFLVGRQMRPREMPHQHMPEPTDIAVKSYDRVEYIPVRDVLGATAQGNYIALHLENREVLHRATMASFADTLAEAGFVRIHRSHMVNPDRVVSAASRGGRVKEVSLSNGVNLPVSERYSANVVSRLNGRVCA